MLKLINVILTMIGEHQVIHDVSLQTVKAVILLRCLAEMEPARQRYLKRLSGCRLR